MTQPIFSIIIPTHNRPELLAACLESLARLDYPRDGFEAIVVDDGSERSPQAAVARAQSLMDLRWLRQGHAGPAAARNAGAASARGTYLAFTDDDCAPAPDWLRTLERRLAAAPGQAIGGPTINVLADNPFAIASQMAEDSMFAADPSDGCAVPYLASSNLTVPADGFHAIGGFDAARFPIAAAEDRDWSERWVHHGRTLLYARDVRVFHAHHLTLSSYFRQHMNRGRGAFWLRQARAGRSGAAGYARRRPRHGPLATALGMLGRADWRQAPALAALLLMWRAVHAAGFLWEYGTFGMPGLRQTPRRPDEAGS